MFYRKYLDGAVTCKAETAMPDLRFPQASLLRIHVFLMSSCVNGLVFPQHFNDRYQLFHLQGLTGLRVVHSSWTPQIL